MQYYSQWRLARQIKMISKDVKNTNEATTLHLEEEIKKRKGENKMPWFVKFSFEESLAKITFQKQISSDVIIGCQNTLQDASVVMLLKH